MFNNNEEHKDAFMSNFVTPALQTEDLENGVNNNNNNNSTIPLKGILKKTDPNETIRDRNLGEIIVKILLTLLLVIICSPIIICDLYYALNDDSCVDESPSGLAISLKTYLLTSGYCGLAYICFMIISSCSVSDNNSDSTNGCIIGLMAIIILFCGLFQVVWNILGGFIFWGTVYKEGNCDKNISTYVFVSLILKYVGNYLALKNSMSSNKKENN